MRGLGIIMAIAAVAVLTPSTYASHSGRIPCSQMSECPSGLFCSFGECTHCLDNDECGPGGFCRNPGRTAGECEGGAGQPLPGGVAAPGGYCTEDNHCAVEEMCNIESNTCVPRPPPPPAELEEPAPQVLTPRLQIPLFTLQPFTRPTQSTEAGKTFLNIDFIGQYLAGVYKFFVGIVGVIAGLMIIWAGVKWLTAAGSPDKIGEAKRKIADALVGLILVLGSYVILSIINPELVIFKPLRVEVVPRIELTLEDQEEEEVTVGGRAVVEGTVCSTLESCRALCNTPIQSWPTSSSATPEASQLQTITTSSGIDVSGCRDGCRGTAAFVQAIQRAGGEAQRAPDGPYTIAITSAFRPLRKQIKLICDKIKLIDKGQYDPNKLGRAIAWPGGSNHGKGIAADVVLVRGSERLTCSACYNVQTSTRYTDTAPILADIMFEAGLVRYCREIWHFELPSNTDCRSDTCRSNVVSCP